MYGLTSLYYMLLYRIGLGQFDFSISVSFGFQYQVHGFGFFSFGIRTPPQCKSILVCKNTKTESINFH